MMVDLLIMSANYLQKINEELKNLNKQEIHDIFIKMN